MDGIKAEISINIGVNRIQPNKNTGITDSNTYFLCMIQLNKNTNSMTNRL